ncbi:ATP-binding protein [Streptomyces sp. MST-110588]|uniref:ATP-binding protein n=1 Tax=Streptomyces sp. MST-110588 TaxID=2833628 RepID=UPI001F5D50CF|nr:ATP-binding protein [Streptomyces sp. MST-110588]
MWLLPPALLAICAAVAVPLLPTAARSHAVWIGVVATAAVAFAGGKAARRGRAIDELRRQYAEREAALQRQMAQQEAETLRMAKETLPAAMARLQKGMPVEDVLRSTCQVSRVSPGFEAAHHAVLRYVLQAVEAEEDLRDAAQRAFVNIARRVQAIVHQQALELREMEDRHGQDPQVFGDLLHLDHRTALIGRLADSIAVLGGARPGRQWQKDIPLFNVLRGAMSRITDYQRVDLHSVADVGVLGRAAEPLIHAVAELLDNATRYSPPQTRVHLTATEVQSGVAVEIEDAGLGLTDEARIRAERALAQHSSSGLDLDDLGESPRLGLAVVGRLSHTNRFKVALRVSAYGGVRVVLVVPPDLITVTPVPGGALAKAPSLPPPRRPSGPKHRAEAAMEEPVPTTGSRTANGLPQRRRRTRAVIPSVRPQQAASAADSRPPASAGQPPPAGLWMSAFLDGASGASADGSPAHRPHGPSDEEPEQ